MRDERTRGVVHQDDVGCMGHQCLQPGADAVLTGRAARNRRQASGNAVQSGVDQFRVADRLQQRDMLGQCLRGVTDDRLAGERQELLRQFGAEAVPEPAATRMAAMRMMRRDAAARPFRQ